MIDLVQLQKRVYQNKIEKGFNVTDIYQEEEIMNKIEKNEKRSYENRDGVLVKVREE